MSDRRSAQAQSNKLAVLPITRQAGAAHAWHGSVNGHAQAVVVIVAAGHGKPTLS